MPYSQKNFYRVICEVDDYDQFVPYMTNSYIIKDTVKKQVKNGIAYGKFDAETTIGFQSLVNFAYISKVSYKEHEYIITRSGK